MTLAVPLALLGLLPWAAAAAWAWRRARAGREVAVPSLALWPRRSLTPDPRRRGRPPAAVLLALLAALLAVLASAGPRLDAVWPTVEADVVEDDRPSMRAGDALAEARRRLRSLGRVVAVAPGEGVPTAVLTDADVAESDHVLRVPPATPRPNAAVTAVVPDGRRVLVKVAASAVPPRLPATLTLEAGSAGTDRMRKELTVAELPATLVTDFPAPVVVATLAAAGDRWAGDDALTGRLAPPPPRLAAEATLPASALRFARAFADARPPRADSPTVRLTTDPLAPPPAVVVSPATLDVQGSVEVAGDAPSGLAAAVDWSRLEGLRGSPRPPGDWRAAARAGDAWLLAAGAGRAWVGFDARDFDETLDYVRLLAAAVEVASPPGLPPEPRPPAEVPVPPAFDESAARAWFDRHARGPRLAGPLAAGAVALLVAAAAAAGRKNLDTQPARV